MNFSVEVKCSFYLPSDLSTPRASPKVSIKFSLLTVTASFDFRAFKIHKQKTNEAVSYNRPCMSNSFHPYREE